MVSAAKKMSSKLVSFFRSRLKYLTRGVVNCTFIFCCGHCVIEYVCDVTQLEGPSMLPTFNKEVNNYVLVEHFSTIWGTLKKGDIVITRSPIDPSNMVCKRIAAMEGQQVERPEGMFGMSASKFLRVPKGHIWLLGDNPDNSTDSRYYGPVPEGLVRGRVCFKLWPPSEFGRLS